MPYEVIKDGKVVAVKKDYKTAKAHMRMLAMVGWRINRKSPKNPPTPAERNEG